MSREVVKYRNDFNTVNFSTTFNSVQANLFFSIISRLRNQGTRTVTLSYKRIAQLSGMHYGRRVGLFHDTIQKTYDKISHLSIYQNNKDVFHSINLFSEFTNDKKHQKVSIKINSDFANFFNHLAKQFTRFSLNQYVGLRSRYAKSMFRWIKLFRLSGHVYLPMKKFRRVLGVPKSYTSHMINQNIINPIKIQLTPLVRNLHIIVKRNGYGNTITGYQVDFKPDNPAYDKAVGFRRSNVGTKRWMVENIKLNRYLTKKQKQKALDNINGTHRYKKHQHEPMKVFNRMLKTCDAHTLYWYYMHRKDRTIHFSEYQVRKLRKAFVKKTDEERLQQIKDKKMQSYIKKMMNKDKHKK